MLWGGFKPDFGSALGSLEMICATCATTFCSGFGVDPYFVAYLYGPKQVPRAKKITNMEQTPLNGQVDLGGLRIHFSGPVRSRISEPAAGPGHCAIALAPRRGLAQPTLLHPVLAGKPL